LRIGDAALKRELWYSLRSSGKSEGASVRQKVLSRAEAKPTVAERQLLELLFADEELRRAILPRLDPGEYEDLPTVVIFQALIDIENEGTGFDFQNLSQKTDGDALAAELLPMLLMNDVLRSNNEDTDERWLIAERCIDTLRLIRVDRRIDELRTEVAAAERNGDNEKMDRLAIEQIELTRQRSALLPRAEAVPSGH